MDNKFLTKIGNIPTPIAGLALGIASLGWCWDNNLDAKGIFQEFAAVFSATIIIALLIKFLLHPKKLWADLCHPVVGSVVPTFAMSLMVISSALQHYIPSFATSLWYIAVSTHVLFFTVFLLYRVRDFKINDLLPSWFVPPIGLVVGALTNPSADTLFIAQWLLYFGVACYFLMLPFMLLRLIFATPLADNTKPTLAILAAPPNLCLAGYLSIVEQPSMLLVFFFLGFALLMTTLVYLALPILLKLSFTPAYAAFTFPVVIGATAIAKTAVYLEGLGMSTEVVLSLHYIANFELVVASAIVSYVSFRYLKHFLPNPIVRKISAKAL